MMEFHLPVATLAAVVPFDMESDDLLVLYLLDNGARKAAVLATKRATRTIRDLPIIFQY